MHNGLKIFLFFGIYILCCNPAFSQKTAEGKIIHSAFSPKIAEWNISWPGRVSQYDLVYLSPPIDPLQGIPLGNGETGVLFWCEDSKIIAVVNKSDLWDDAAFDTFHNWSKDEEDLSTTQRHACRIVIDFKFPVFNVMYLSGFKARLNLADASMALESQSPFGNVSLTAFVDHQTGVLFYSLSSSLNEDVPVDISVERFGSRTYSHWYSQVNRDASIGLPGTEAEADNSGVYLTQKLTSGTFAVGGRVIHDSGTNVNYLREHSHRAVIQLSGNKQKKVQLAFAVTSPKENEPVAEVKNILSSAKENGADFFQKSNAKAWQSIWSRSFMDYGDDYLNNLWYLTMYYANTSQGGKYPGRFNNGLWGWSHDVQNWNFYFHWNQQELYWPLNAAGFHELVVPYLDFRFNSLPHAKNDAKEIFKTQGAFISDVADRRGFNSSGEKDNHTPIAEIALDFWRQYQYTGDKTFLKEKALPFIVEAARFFESLFVKEDDGLYHAKEGTGYEGWIKLKDGLTELVYARVLFSTALEVLDAAGTDLPETVKWKEILAHLAPLPVMEPGDSAIVRDGSDFIMNRGLFKGEKCPTGQVFAGGWGIKEKKMMPAGNVDGIFPTVPSSPAFPSGLIGLSQKGSELFNKMTSTALLSSAEVTGWDPVPVVFARLGLANELDSGLQRFPSRWQIYCNGWGHWGVEFEINKDAEWFFRTNTVRDVKSKDKFPLPMWTFRHMSMESMSVLATAMNESLLQSYDGILRVFPAFPTYKNGRFTLHAEGGFIVSSEIQLGEVKWVCIKSLFGNPCRLQLPWQNASAWSDIKKGAVKLSGEIAGFKTKPDEIIMILPQWQKPDDWVVSGETPSANEQPRYHSSGKTRLGIPRMY